MDLIRNNFHFIFTFKVDLDERNCTIENKNSTVVSDEELINKTGNNNEVLINLSKIEPVQSISMSIWFLFGFFIFFG